MGLFEKSSIETILSGSITYRQRNNYAKKEAKEFAKFTSNGAWYYDSDKDLWRSGAVALNPDQLYNLYLEDKNKNNE